MTTDRGRSVRDRDVVLLLAIVVLAVLGANVAAAVIPGVDALLAGLPLVVLLLVVVTAVVLWRAVARRR